MPNITKNYKSMSDRNHPYGKKPRHVYNPLVARGTDEFDVLLMQASPPRNLVALHPRVWMARMRMMGDAL